MFEFVLVVLFDLSVLLLVGFWFLVDFVDLDVVLWCCYVGYVWLADWLVVIVLVFLCGWCLLCLLSVCSCWLYWFDSGFVGLFVGGCLMC